MKHKKLIIIVLAATAIVLPLGWAAQEFYIDPILEGIKNPQERKIQAIMQGEEFKQRAYNEAERLYYRGLIEDAKVRLEELDGTGFSSEASAAAALVSYLEYRGREDLARHAEEIVALPRWVEVIAIASHETGLCTAGVGASRNNCGAITDGAGGFKRYASEMESIEDIAALLQKPAYKDKTIAQMNGRYCVDELNAGNRCAGWTESIELALAQIKTRLYGA